MILNVARKELKSVFASPMGWVILALLQFAFGTYFLNGVNEYFEVMSGAIRPAERTGVTSFIGQSVFGLASFVMLFSVPLLSMRLISEERRSNTLPYALMPPCSCTPCLHCDRGYCASHERESARTPGPASATCSH